jgi:hypothetical protein
MRQILALLSLVKILHRFARSRLVGGQVIIPARGNPHKLLFAKGILKEDIGRGLGIERQLLLGILVGAKLFGVHANHFIPLEHIRHPLAWNFFQDSSSSE